MFFEQSGWKIFSVAKIDVSVSLWFLIIMGLIAYQAPLLAPAIAISVLIHEFGHAIPSKLWKLSPSILLHGFGGLCFHDPAPNDAKDIAVVLAGPLLEIAVGLLTFVALPFVATFGIPILDTFLMYFAYVSILWGLFNLLVPVYPLDGGKLFLLALRRVMDEDKAQEYTLYVSIGCSVLMIPAAIYYGFWFIGFLGVFIALDNWNMLQSGARMIERRAKVRTSDFVKTTLQDAEVAYNQNDFREAARLCHVLRTGNDTIGKKQTERMWEILAVSTVELGDYEEAVGWLKRAPDTATVKLARKETEKRTTN